jgi:glycogen(starch) synthase
MTVDAVGGVWTYALELSKAFAAGGIEVLLISMGPSPKAAQREAVGAIQHVQLVEGDFKLEWMEDSWKEVDEAGEWLLSLEQQFKPETVHLNGYSHAALPFRAPKLVVAHSCVLSWWHAVKGQTAPSAWNTYRERVGAGLRAADLIVAPSREMLAQLCRWYGDIASARVINNGISIHESRSPQKEEVIFTAGRLWDEAKNIQTLAEAAPGVVWPIYAAGSISKCNSRDDEAHSPSTSRENFTPIGQLSEPEMQHWFSKAAIYCLPARYEPFGLSILEAAAAECALVLGDIPSLREIWDGAALFVSPKKPAEIQKNLNGLIADGSLRQELARRAKLRAKDFTAEKMAAAYLDIYRELSERHTKMEQPRAAVVAAGERPNRFERASLKEELCAS